MLMAGRKQERPAGVRVQPTWLDKQCLRRHISIHSLLPVSASVSFQQDDDGFSDQPVSGVPFAIAV